MRELEITKGDHYSVFASTSTFEALIVVAANGAVYVHGRLVPQTDAEREKMRDAFNPSLEGEWDAPASEVTPPAVGGDVLHVLNTLKSQALQMGTDGPRMCDIDAAIERHSPKGLSPSDPQADESKGNTRRLT